MQGTVGIVHCSVQRFDERTVCIADFGCEGGIAILEFDGAPLTYGQTAHAMVEEREQCLRSGMVDCITKPIDPDALVAVILARQAPPAGPG